jgi:hypothetical protein
LAAWLLFTHLPIPQLVGLSVAAYLTADYLYPSLPPVGDDMAYLNRTIVLRFDGTGVIEHEKPDEQGNQPTYPNLGPGMWVELRNPMLMPPSMLLPKRKVETDDKGIPIDRELGMLAGAEVMAGLIVNWSLPDPLDLSDDPPVLPVPPSAEDVLKVPVAVTEAIGGLLQRAKNPR